MRPCKVRFKQSFNWTETAILLDCVFEKEDRRTAGQRVDATGEREPCSKPLENKQERNAS